MDSQTSRRHRRGMWIGMMLVLAALPAFAAPEDPLRQLKELGREAMKRLEVQPRPEAPAWAERTDAPVMTFVQMADIHTRPAASRSSCGRSTTPTGP